MTLWNNNFPDSRFELEEPDPLKTDEFILNMGPQHPSTHGVLRVVLKTDGEIVEKATPYIGYLHRTFEKHAEEMTWPQIVPYVDRMDYLASMNNALGYALAIEKLAGIEVNERAQYLRVIVAELNRIASHLVFYGTFGLDVGAFTPFLYGFREREMILDLFEEISGGRLLYNYIWIGGVAFDTPDGWLEKVSKFCDYFETKIKEYNDLLSFNKIFIDRTAGVGVIPPDLAINYGLSGPTLRGSGIHFDIRKNDPYGIYDRFDFNVCVGDGTRGVIGDSWNRYWVRMQEMIESLKIVRQALDQIPEGDAKETVPRNVRVPAGEIYFRTETPRGELGYYIISDGGKTPVRVKVRAPAFSNLSILPAIAKGTMVADLVAILGSFDIVLGEIDR
ncbi:NAD(P)H-quinone oxidoreductase subunit H [Caldithrix abyssi DSM 13497]|uniref:NADH-quinone oxidoreductase subunit D n=1 Tax=Caldithrix abyssi DSM 13497 TaxID=880073 RepID=H1XQ48_CALAY|nr:NADH-quinone oxidoreductase subunit D [Caldithrix abyssi]APF18277.1 nuoD NADH dehydrogenase subunit D [Caldithrix abyssi DSM 13497]EHO42299.1 NAD(P)H-quinone oxidoreductase subunit H [Caldithrix abyssi DSM 13497]